MMARLPRFSPRFTRRVADAIALVLAIAGLLLFVVAPLVSGPQPWPAEKAGDGRGLFLMPLPVERVPETVEPRGE